MKVAHTLLLSCALSSVLFAADKADQVVKYDKVNGFVYYADGSVYMIPKQAAAAQETPQTTLSAPKTVEMPTQSQSTKYVVEQPQYVTATQSAMPKKTPSNDGNFTAGAKVTQVLDGKDNGYDSNTGSSYYVKAGYETPSVKGVSAKVSGYVTGDTGLTDKDKTIAKAIFMGDSRSNDTLTETKANIGEAYVKYKGDALKAQAGHFELDTPMTKNAVSTVPNYYEGVVVSSKKVVDNTIVVGAHITKMAYGARAAADWGNIGEQTTTGGAIKVYSEDETHDIETLADTTTQGIRRGKFTNMGKVSGAGENTAGVSVIGAINTSLKDTTIQAWEYYAFDVANITYVDGIAKFKLKNGVSTMVGAQILHENIQGKDGAPTLVGLKGALGYKNAKLIVAVNKSNGDVILNVWGGDPAYTSSIYSRNAYRPDVSAYKVIGEFNVPEFKKGMPKDLTLMISHAGYGQSTLPNTQKDAKETDVVLKYKPTKKLLVQLSNVQRESEFDGFKGKDKTQNHSRLVMSYEY